MRLGRKYLDTAFGQKKSRDLFPDHAIALWHPERKNPPRDEKKVGKEEHIAEVVKNLSVKCKPSEVRLLRLSASPRIAKVPCCSRIGGGPHTVMP